MSVALWCWSESGLAVALWYWTESREVISVVKLNMASGGSKAGRDIQRDCCSVEPSIGVEETKVTER